MHQPPPQTLADASTAAALIFPGRLMALIAQATINIVHGNIAGANDRLNNTTTHRVTTYVIAILALTATLSSTHLAASLSFLAIATVIVLCDHAWRTIPIPLVIALGSLGLAFNLSSQPGASDYLIGTASQGMLLAIGVPLLNEVHRLCRFNRTGRLPPRRTWMRPVGEGDLYILLAVTTCLPAGTAATFWAISSVGMLINSILHRASSVRGAWPILLGAFSSMLLGAHADDRLITPIARALDLMAA